MDPFFSVCTVVFCFSFYFVLSLWTHQRRLTYSHLPPTSFSVCPKHYRQIIIVVVKYYSHISTHLLSILSAHPYSTYFLPDLDFLILVSPSDPAPSFSVLSMPFHTTATDLSPQTKLLKQSMLYSHTLQYLLRLRVPDFHAVTRRFVVHSFVLFLLCFCSLTWLCFKVLASFCFFCFASILKCNHVRCDIEVAVENASFPCGK